MPDQENVQLKNDPVESGAEVPVEGSQTPELDDAALDAQFQSFLNDGGEVRENAADSDTKNDTQAGATSGESEGEAGSEAADDAPADDEDDPFAEIKAQGRQLKESLSEKPNKLVDTRAAQGETTEKTLAAGHEPPNNGQAEPPRLQTADVEIHWDALPKVVMVGDQPHNLKSVYDEMTKDYQDDPVLPLLTFALSQASQQKRATQEGQSIPADKFTEFQQQVVQAMQDRDRLLWDLQYRSFLSDVAQAGAPEVFEIDADPEHQFFKDLEQMDEETKIFFETKKAQGDAKGVAKVISAWRQSTEKKKVAEVDAKRMETKAKVDSMLRSTAGDRGRQQTAAKGPHDELSDAEADMVFEQYLREE